ncbi:MAG: DUF2889 domain-containing protein [Thermodesulfobacteriota bacterium]
MTLRFMRNKLVQVEPLREGALSVDWRSEDDLLRAEIRMKVRLPDLEIEAVEGGILSSTHPECAAASNLLAKVVGVRVGPGLRKIVYGLLGGTKGCEELAEGVLECCNAVILNFTLPQIQAMEHCTEEERRERFKEMLRFNPRLVRSCVAFADDSPMMQGLDL